MTETSNLYSAVSAVTGIDRKTCKSVLLAASYVPNGDILEEARAAWSELRDDVNYLIYASAKRAETLDKFFGTEPMETE